MVGTKIHFTAGITLHPAAFGQIAQLVEQRTENPRAAGSSPALTTWGSSSVGRAAG